MRGTRYGEQANLVCLPRLSTSLHFVKSTGRDVVRFEDGVPSELHDQVVVEEPLELRIGETPIAVVMRTPGDDIDLALGFALSEGILIDPTELEAVVEVGENRLRLDTSRQIDADRFRRNLYTSSSCGVCGKGSIDAVRMTVPEFADRPAIEGSVLVSLPGRMRARQETFAKTGGLHAAALFTMDGAFRALREDIGRHNAVDKVIGVAAADAWPLTSLALMVSGRISFEIVQKAAMAGIPCVAGVSAASSLAIELASDVGMTVVGFLRDGTFNLYVGRLKGATG
jgi:FdhD protein